MSTDREPSKMSSKTRCLVALGVILLLGPAVLIVNMRASRQLDAKLSQIQALVAKWRATDAEARPVLLGAATEGNACRDYAVLEFAFSALGEFDVALGGELVKHMEEGLEPSAAALAQFKRYRACLSEARQGLSRGHCDWAFEWEQGAAGEIPNLITMRDAANLMAYDAHLAEDAATATQYGLEIVALSADLMRNPTLIGAMVGHALRAIGLQSLERTLQRADLEPADAERIVAVLGAVPRVAIAPYLDAERVSFEVMILAMGGRKVSPNAPLGSPGQEFGLIQKLGGDVFVARELTGYETFLDRLVQISRLPRAERKAAQAVMDADLAASWYLVAKIAIPNLLAVQDRLVEANVLLDIVRVLAAAQRRRLEKGAFPAALSELAGPLGALTDPFDPQGSPLRYAVTGGEVRCYSVYLNGVDDGGAHRAESIRKDDLVLVTRAGS